MSNEEALWTKIDDHTVRLSNVETDVKLQASHLARLEQNVQDNHSSMMVEIHGFRTDLLAKIEPLCHKVSAIESEAYREEGRAEERAKEQERKDKSLARFKLVTGSGLSLIGILTAFMAWLGFGGP